MKKNPGRKHRRNLFFQMKRRQGDLNRRSTHVMRSKMGMTKQEVFTSRRPVGRWRRLLEWIKNKIRRQ